MDTMRQYVKTPLLAISVVNQCIWSCLGLGLGLGLELGLGLGG